MGGGAEDLNNNLSLFSKDCQVEVSTDEEGFKGAWYVATVVQDPSSKSRSGSKKKKKNVSIQNRKIKNVNAVYVEYHNLVADDDASKPLREYKDVAFLRPSPPPERVHNLELYDVVDAFYRDGWWTGVITAFVDNSKFVVTFQNPPDEIQFSISELRVHRQWVDGKWVRPEKQRTAGLMFSAGKKVQVSFEKEDYRDVWFPATVLEDSGSGSFLVEYQRPGPGVNDEPGLHKVNVDYLHIRPSPPHLRDKNFVLLEKVDAFFDFGWWSGVITKVLAESRYVVFFKHTNKTRELSHSELRPHMEWKDGKWFSATQRQILSPEEGKRRIMSFPSMLSMWHKDVVSNNVNGTETAVLHDGTSAVKGVSEERTPSALNLMETQTEQTTPCVGNQSNVVTSLKKKTTKHTNLDSDDMHSRPSKKLKEGNASSQLNTCPSVAPNKETVVGFNSPTIGHYGTSSAEEPIVSDQPFSKTENLSHGKKVRSKRGKGADLNSQTVGSVGKRGRLATAEIKGRQALARGDSAEKTTEDVRKESVKKDISVPIVIGLECNGRKSAAPKKTHQLPNQKSPKFTGGQTQQQSGASLTHKSPNNMKANEEISQKRKRGRPPKIRPNSSKTSAAVNQQNGDAVSNQMAVEDSQKNELGSLVTSGIESNRKEGLVPGKEQLNVSGDKKVLPVTPKQKNTSSSVIKLILSNKDKLPNENLGQASKKQPKKFSSVTAKRGRVGRRRTISLNTESSTQDSQDASKEKADEGLVKDSAMKNVELAVDKLPDSMADDQPLSMWFEGMHTPATVDCSAVVVGKTVEQQCSEASERQNEIVLHSSPVDANGGDNLPGDIQSLPFVKKTPLWETIESMEVFRMIPQKPHFRPLDDFKESSREGLAIGSMVTFSSVVEKTSRMQFDNPRSNIEDCLETLVELESHGFDVEVVRGRLTGLLLIKDKQEELEDQSKGVRSKIVEHSVEKSKIDEEIAEINKQIRELQEKRALALSMKEMKDTDIADLEVTVNGVNEEMKNVRLEFVGLAAAPW